MEGLEGKVDQVIVGSQAHFKRWGDLKKKVISFHLFVDEGSVLESLHLMYSCEVLYLCKIADVD